MFQYQSASGLPFSYLQVYILSLLTTLYRQSHSTPSSLILLPYFFTNPFINSLSFKKTNILLGLLHLLPLKLKTKLKRLAVLAILQPLRHFFYYLKLFKNI